MYIVHIKFANEKSCHKIGFRMQLIFKHPKHKNIVWLKKSSVMTNFLCLWFLQVVWGHWENVGAELNPVECECEVLSVLDSRRSDGQTKDAA